MRAHYLQHVPFEGLGCIEPWLQAADFAVTGTRFYEAPDLPEPDEADLLVVMGGPMSVNDEVEFPWLVQEKRFIRAAIQSGKSVLGVCLGAQLIASAMGARVYRNHTREVGWLPVQAVPHFEPGTFHFPLSTTAFHWHGETFDLPLGAVHLARSAACENQAFQLGPCVIGLQFHLETTPESARTIIGHCRAELQLTGAVQTEAEILAAAPETYQAANALLGDILSALRAAQC